MADQLTWDFEALSYMQHILHAASNELMENEAKMRVISNDAHYDLNNSGAVSRRLIDEADALTRKVGAIGEETEALEQALRRVIEMFRLTEDENRAQAEAVQDGAGSSDGFPDSTIYRKTIESFHWTTSPINYRNVIGWNVAPDWLEEAADRMFEA